MNASTDVQEILRRPGAPALYARLRKAAWLSPFLESPSRAHRVLGAALLIEEMVSILAPERNEAEVVDERVDARRTRRLNGRKRAAALWLAGCTFEDIGKWLDIPAGKAARWARAGCEV